MQYESFPVMLFNLHYMSVLSFLISCSFAILLIEITLFEISIMTRHKA